MIEHISLPSLPTPRFHYTQCVRAGDILTLSGMIALDAETGKRADGGPGAEAAKILANLALALRDLKLTQGNILSARIFTTQFDDFAAINTAWENFFPKTNPPPARTAVGVSALPLGASVEIEFQLYDPKQ